MAGQPLSTALDPFTRKFSHLIMTAEAIWIVGPSNVATCIAIFGLVYSRTPH